MDARDDTRPEIAQGIARRLVPLRWARSQKLAGYYDPERHALIYQDARGRIIDQVALPLVRNGESLTGMVE